jgi:hypothetical protein
VGVTFKKLCMVANLIFIGCGLAAISSIGVYLPATHIGRCCCCAPEDPIRSRCCDVVVDGTPNQSIHKGLRE